ncbi:hypothetical protein [uncultured Deefgea sp.]|uniref:hypothetical protein n=1 Tax=uncultured Deefgea sp. TaxID=1304914 RepID=UPI0026397CB5|nr:hypothetical protein [uncultured Deefgea sp.]
MDHSLGFNAIRQSLSKIPSDHDATGEHRPTVNEIYTPELHASALDLNTPVVVGARGAGKSFWAGVLEQDDTRAVAAKSYPHLGLDRLVVRAGYTGFATEGVVSPKTIDARVPNGEEENLAFDFWQAVIIRAARSVFADENSSVKQIMQEFSDPEDAQLEFKILDKKIAESDKILLVSFDALDTLSKDWKRSTLLLDALFEVIWSLRVRRAIRAKIFIRPEQLNDESLRFIEMPKLRSSCVELSWSQVELYGLLFWRLIQTSSLTTTKAINDLALLAGVPKFDGKVNSLRNWPLIRAKDSQQFVMEQMAGPYMGRSSKKGGTYDWPYNHLADAKGKVTPRSFIKLFVEAAKHEPMVEGQVISAEGIRHGLREASKVRVEQLVIEYKWIKRALAPLAGLTVPCTVDAIYERWSVSNTINIILAASENEDSGFMPPFPIKTRRSHDELLIEAMEKIGVFSFRVDGRIDIPDLFRVAARMLKKGGTTPTKSK